MGRYLVLWEVEKTRMSTDPKKRAEGTALLMAMVKQDIEKGLVKEWGSVVGETRGFNLFEGSESDLATMVQPYLPFINFEVLPVLSFTEAEEVLKAFSG